MFTLPDPPSTQDATWNPCHQCGILAPVAPDQTWCAACVDPPRCPAAHADDESPCDGDANAVRVVDRTGHAVTGCIWHAAVLLASLVGGRVYPQSHDGAAIAAYKVASTLPPFVFVHTGHSRGWSW
jgi:hypothetical protein